MYWGCPFTSEVLVLVQILVEARPTSRRDCCGSYGFDRVIALRESHSGADATGISFPRDILRSGSSAASRGSDNFRASQGGTDRAAACAHSGGGAASGFAREFREAIERRHTGI